MATPLDYKSMFEHPLIAYIHLYSLSFVLPINFFKETKNTHLRSKIKRFKKIRINSLCSKFVTILRISKFSNAKCLTYNVTYRSKCLLVQCYPGETFILENQLKAGSWRDSELRPP